MKLITFPIVKEKLNKKNIAIAAGVVLLIVLLAAYVWMQRTDRVSGFNLGDYLQKLGAGVVTVTHEELEITLPVGAGRAYEQTAQAGEGITHLARRAAKEYLDRTGQTANLTAEHKVYIEDYLAKQTGNDWLDLGETVSFSENLIREAVENARQLSDEQLDNLKQYSAQISSF